MEKVIYSPINFELFSVGETVVITDKTLHSIYGERFSFLKTKIVPAGEDAKTLQQVEEILLFLVNNDFPKSGTLVALGGGTIGDLVGFVAKIYKRGVKFVNVPTTLLAMIDSSIGGKNAINMNGVKNLVGSIKFADEVYIDTSFLQSPNVITNAIGEVMKYCLLMQDGLEYWRIYSQMISGDFINSMKLISKCVEFKQSIVKLDENDIDIRRQLNMGHTLAHALELTQSYSHGVAVSLGLALEATIGHKLGITNSAVVKWLNENISVDISSIITDKKKAIEIMLNDKKNINGKICFVFPINFGEYSVEFLSPSQVRELL